MKISSLLPGARLLEETGIKVADWRLVGVVTIDVEENVGVVLFICTAQAASFQIRESAEGQLAWFRLDALPLEQMVPDLPHLLRRVLDCTPTTPPFTAQFRYNADDQLEISFAD